MFCVHFCFLPVSCAALRVNNNNMKTRQFPTLAFSTFPDKALFSKPLRSLLRLLVAVPISGYSPSTRRTGFGRDPAMSAHSGLGALGWIDMPVNAIKTAILKQSINQPSRRALAHSDRLAPLRILTGVSSDRKQLDLVVKYFSDDSAFHSRCLSTHLFMSV